MNGTETQTTHEQEFIYQEIKVPVNVGGKGSVESILSLSVSYWTTLRYGVSALLKDTSAGHHGLSVGEGMCGSGGSRMFQTPNPSQVPLVSQTLLLVSILSPIRRQGTQFFGLLVLPSPCAV